MSKLISFFTGGYGYAALFVLGFGLGGAGIGYFIHTLDAGEVAGLNLKISKMELATSQKQTADITTSLNTLQDYIAQMQHADIEYNSTLATINANFASLKTSIANVKISNPLPLDCKPDAARLSILTRAIAAANATAAPGK